MPHRGLSPTPLPRRRWLVSTASAGLIPLQQTSPTGRKDAAEPPSYPRHDQLLVVRDCQGLEHPVRRPIDWDVRKAHILSHFQAVAGALPGGERREPVTLRELERFERDGLLYRRIRYAAEPGDEVPAWLVERPGENLAFRAGILALHQTTRIGKDEPAGLGGLPNLHYGRELAARGYLVICPDYPRFGENTTDPYALGYASATMKGIWNHCRALDVLAALSDDPRPRFGVIGHSLGGHNAIFAALFDDRIHAVVTSCGFNAFPRYQEGNIAGWSHAGYMPRLKEVYLLDLAKVPFDFPELLAALAPRPVFINAPQGDDNFAIAGVRDCVEAARPVYALHGAERALVARHPDAAHDFPAGEREAAYNFLAQQLVVP